jgi:Lrp/AsnC family transcriptional regulator, leucine-responsive regulatory protein
MNVLPTILDETDRKILALLQRDARMTNAALAAEVGLTAPSVFERIRKLEQRGVIRDYTVKLDPAALGKTLTAFIRLTVAYDEKHAKGIQALRQDPDILECYSVAGEDCFVIKTQVGSPEELEALINRIRSQMTVLRSVTMIALSAIKESAPINVLDSASAAAPPPNSKPRAAVRNRR